MKSLIATTLAALLTLSMAACSVDDPSDNTDNADIKDQPSNDGNDSATFAPEPEPPGEIIPIDEGPFDPTTNTCRVRFVSCADPAHGNRPSFCEIGQCQPASAHTAAQTLCDAQCGHLGVDCSLSNADQLARCQ